MYYRGYRTLDREYADSTGVVTRASIYNYRVSGPSFRTWVFDRLEVPAQAQILDVGSGPGGIWSEHAERLPEDWNLTLLDLSPGMLADARETGVRCNLINGEAEHLPFPDHSMDVITAFHMLYDVDSIERAVEEFRRVLEGGGTFHATTNGDRHLLALRKALADVGVRGDFVSKPAVGRFSMQTGADTLGRSFGGVEVHTHRETLMVPDPAPLLAYAMTIEDVADQLDADRRERFESLVREQVTAEGAFRLSTESCLFLAS